MRRFFVTFLSIAIVLTSLPIVSFAAEGESEKWNDFYDEVTEFTEKYNDIEYFDPITVVDDKAYKGGEDINTKVVDDVLYVDSSELGVGEDAISDDSIIVDDDITYIPIEECSEELELETVDGEEGTIYCKPYQTKRLVVDCEGELPEVDSIDSIESPDGNVLLQFDSEDDTKNAYEILNDSDNVKSVTGENTYSTCAYTAADFPLSENLSWGADYIDSPQAVSYAKENKLNKQVTVAVIDTGVDVDHQYLQGRILGTSKSVINSSYDDQNGHGTHVSGIIVDNTPDNVKILAVQALNAAGKGTDYQLASAVNYAVSQKVDVINMSLGGLDVWSNSVLKTAIQNAYDNNITICVAAGNESDNAKNYYPANSSCCITVGAVDSSGKPGYYSNYGSVVDVSAPGSNIFSSITDGDYAEASGTSMATPFVSAACAMKILLTGKNSPKSTISYVKKNVTPHNDNRKDKYGTGIISLTNYVPKERTAPVCFNRLGGYYQDNSISISMSSADKSAKIYYTTDGTEPTKKNGTLYSKAITISKTTTFKAVAYDGSKYKSKVTKASYIFGQIARESDFTLKGSTITKYSGPAGDLVIPEKIKGKAITVIGASAFSDKNLTSVVIPKSVIKIDDNAFANNNLDLVDAKGVTYIGNNAFENNNRLSDTKLGKVNYIGNSAFANCNLNELSLDFSAVTEIGAKAFDHCNFTTINNSEKLTKIGESAFANNDFFSIDFPNVKSVGDGAFSDNNNLKTVKLGKATTIGSKAFYNCFNLDNVTLTKAESIGTKAFAYCNLAGTVSLPAVKKVLSGAFAFTGIKKVSLPVCTNVGANVFKQCSDLVSLSVPKCEYFGDYTNDSPSLKELNLPSVKQIGKIYDCAYLETIHIPNCYSAADGCEISNCSALKAFSAPLLTVMPNISNCSSIEIINLPNVIDCNGVSIENLNSLKTLNLSAVSKTPVIYHCASLQTAIFTSATTLSNIVYCNNLTNIVVPNLKSFNDSSLSTKAIKELRLDSATNVTLNNANEATDYYLPKVKTLSSNNKLKLSVSVPKTAALSNVSKDSDIYTNNTSLSGYNVSKPPVIKTDLPESYVLNADTTKALALSVFCSNPSYQWQCSADSSFSSITNIVNNNRNTIVPEKTGYYRCVVTDNESGKKVTSAVCVVKCDVKTAQIKFNSSNKLSVLWRNTLFTNVRDDVFYFPIGDTVSVYEDVNVKSIKLSGKDVTAVNGLYDITVNENAQITSEGRIDLSKVKITNTSSKDKHYGNYYSGAKRTPKLKLTYNNKELVINKDYTICITSDDAPILPDLYTFDIVGIGDYYGKLSDSFEIHNASINDCKFEEIKPQPYTSSFVTPEIKATIDGKAVDDFMVSYVNNIGVGTATVTVQGRGYIDGVKDINFKIGYDISGAEITLNKSTCYHSYVNPCKPKATVVYRGVTLKQNKDYKITYKNNNAVGKATAVITGIGDYMNSSNLSFKIVDGVPFEAKLSKTSFVYSGGVQRPTVTVKNNSGKALTYKKDFTVDYSNWSSTNVGTYKVTVNFIGNYCGSKTYTYKITAQSKVTPKLNRNIITVNGTVQRPSITVTDANGKKLTYNKDFTVSYSNFNSKNVGRYTVTVKMKGNYSGSKTYPYYINPKPTEFLASNQGGFKAQSKGFTLKWKKQASQTTGYQIQYSTRSDFKNAATVWVSNPNTTSKTITGRAGNTRYYVRIRTYKTINGSNFYSSWNSGTKSVVTLR